MNRAENPPLNLSVNFWENPRPNSILPVEIPDCGAYLVREGDVAQAEVAQGHSVGLAFVEPAHQLT